MEGRVGQDEQAGVIVGQEDKWAGFGDFEGLSKGIVEFLGQRLFRIDEAGNPEGVAECAEEVQGISDDAIAGLGAVQAADFRTNR